MWKVSEFRKKIVYLSDYLPWAILVAKGTVLNKDGSFQKTFSYRGADLDSSTQEELMITVAKLNNSLRRLDGNWCMYAEAKRDKSIAYPNRTFPDPITALIDSERQAYFSRGEHFENHYYFSLIYLPPEDNFKRFESAFVESQDKVEQRENDKIEAQLKLFLSEVDRIRNLFRTVMPECHELNDEETLTYLHSCISPKRHPIKVPHTPAFIDAYLADTPLTGGFSPCLAKHRLAIVTILGFPQTTRPGILDELNRLDFEYRWVTRFIPLDKLEANKELGNYRRMWFAKRKSLFTMLKETLSRSESAMIDTDALDKFGDAQDALSILNDDLASFGYFTSCVVLMAENKHDLEKKVRRVEKAINEKGFATILEKTNALSAWMGSIPCIARANIRRPIINSMNLAHMFPVSSVWAGFTETKDLKAPPLMHCQTSGSTPFRLALHIGDVAHTMIVGPTGAGKSVLLNLIEAQFRGYKGAKVFIFDKGGSSRILTYAVGGEFFDLANEGANDLSFQPLSRIDEQNERMWALEWLLQILVQEGVTVNPDVKGKVWDALCSLASSPKEERTMTGFAMIVQSKEVKEAILPFVGQSAFNLHGGAYGRLFDNDYDSFSFASWQSFEMENLMKKKSAVMPVLNYIFHRIEQQCNGDPTVIVLDECWLFLDNPIFAEKIEEWLRVMRKKKVGIIFATQSLEDLAKSKIAPLIMSGCKTHIFLPDANAINESSAPIYALFNLNETERHIVAKAIPKRQYYYKSELGSRLFELALDEMPFSLAFIAASSPQEQKKAVEIANQYPKEQFNKKWLEHKNLQSAIPTLKQMEGVG